ncbi:hypothetical protein L7F22_061676 [Adiantum nelumboides]|nr:hypothetical protein [Adiantum nelumboides]
MADFTPLFIGAAAADDVECSNSSAVDAGMPPRPPGRRNHKEPELHELAAAPPNRQQIDAQNTSVAHDEFLGFLYPRETDNDHVLSIDADQQYDAYAAENNIMITNHHLGSFLRPPAAHDEGDRHDDNRADGQHSAEEPSISIEEEMLASLHRLEQQFQLLGEILFFFFSKP